MRRLLALSPLLLAACSTSATDLTIDVTTGQETTAFTDAPAVSAVSITVKSVDGSVDMQQSTTVGGSVDFGNVPNNQAITIGVAGYAGSTQVMSGSSLSGLELAAIGGGVLPVFVERDNTWARPSGQLAAGHVGGTAAVVAGRFLFLTGGAAPSGASSTDPSGVDAYDVLSLGGDRTSPAFSLVPQTIVSLDPISGAADPSQADPRLLLLASTGASLLDYTSSEASTPSLPVGLSSFADAAGGRIIPATGGPTGSRVFVVGATRLGAPSRAVLEVDSDGTLAGYALLTPRQGAAATWVETVGLVVAGGSMEGSGVEVLAPTATSFAPTAYGPDQVQGAAAITDANGGLVLVGGRAADGTSAPTRHLALNCVAPACVPTPIASATLPDVVENIVGYRRPDGTFLVVGDALAGTGCGASFPNGCTLSYTVALGVAGGAGSATLVPFREARKGATAIDVPNGTVAVLGGEHADGSAALSVELFYP